MRRRISKGTLMSRNSLFQMPLPRTMDVGVLFLCCFTRAVLIYMTLHNWRGRTAGSKRGMQSCVMSCQCGRDRTFDRSVLSAEGAFVFLKPQCYNGGERDGERERGGGLRERRRERDRGTASEICLLRVGSMWRRARISPYAGCCDETGMSRQLKTCVMFVSPSEQTDHPCGICI